MTPWSIRSILPWALLWVALMYYRAVVSDVFHIKTCVCVCKTHEIWLCRYFSLDKSIVIHYHLPCLLCLHLHGHAKLFLFLRLVKVPWRLGLGAFTALAHVHSLVGELKSRKLCDTATKKSEGEKVGVNFYFMFW